MKRSLNNRCKREGWLGLGPATLIAVLVLSVGSLGLAQPNPRERAQAAELSPETERSIDRGLDYLARRQNRDGSWGNGEDTPGVTSAVLMAYMVKGYFPDRGRYGEQLARAVDYLVTRGRQGGGYFGGKMYSQGLATLALSEAWGMSERDDIRAVLKQAVEVTLRAQHSSGGWRYQPLPIDQDSSVTVMVLVSLVSAQEAGILVPRETIDRAVAYLERCQTSDGGFAYQLQNRQSAFARSAAATMVLHLLGLHERPSAQRGLEYLHAQGDSVFEEAKFYYYGHYYAVNAMFQAGSEHYTPWYAKIRDALLTKQQKDGRWSGEGGDDYCTASAILVLGVPYRFLPIYQR